MPDPEIQDVEIENLEEVADIPAPNYGSVNVFLHTGEPIAVPLSSEQFTLPQLRETLRGEEYDRNMDGLKAIVNGHTVAQEEERSTTLRAGSVVVFSGDVKAG